MNSPTTVIVVTHFAVLLVKGDVAVNVTLVTPTGNSKGDPADIIAGKTL